ncbi:TPA_exp: Uncharacterized protein A8136_0500 [Trichophyton benhamiae CBS 112371]|nr:TPA_exp: Uncharacterized protein A8136_0500 [Trichophyton benhamiae CBS 112371]
MKTTKLLGHHSYTKAQKSLFYLSRPQKSRRFSFFNPDRTSRLLDRRLAGLGHLIKDEYANIRDSYLKPKHPIVLAHGLLGFDELRIAKRALPAIHYWRGIKDAYSINGVEVITAPVSPSASIEQRAEELLQGIENRAEGRKVNIIAHSMVCSSNTYLRDHRLTIFVRDARYMISKLRPTTFEVVSLTTIATPHRGSAVADYILEWLGGLENGAFKQLTREYLAHTFNPDVMNADDVRYYSYGAVLSPDTWSMFSQSRRILDNEEGPNDGLVSVASSKWGCYKGTLVDVSHIDLINWTNRLKWFAAEITGNRKKFNAVAFYLDIADMLAKEGL